MTGYSRDRSSSDVAVVTEFVEGARAKARKDKANTASAVVAGVLSAALFSKRKKR